MALARIITELTKYSDDLARDLREKGFEVQTFAPGVPSSEVADLELTLKECSSNEVAQLAAERLGHGGMCVFLDSAAMASQVRSIDLFVLKPKVAGQESTAVAMMPPEIVASEDENKEEDYKENELIFAVEESAHALLDNPSETVLPHDPSPVVEKAGVLESLSYGFQSVVSRYIALASNFRKDRVAHSHSAMAHAEEELVPHGLVGQAFVDTHELTFAASPEAVSTLKEEVSPETITTALENEPVLMKDQIAKNDLPSVDHPPMLDLPNRLIAQGDGPQEVAAQAESTQEIPVMFQNDLLHTPHNDDLHPAETHNSGPLTLNENIPDVITKNAITASTAQQF